MFFGATLLHEACFQGLYAAVEGRAFRMNGSAVLTQAAVNALIGIAAFWLVERGPGVVQGRRTRGASVSRRRY